MTSHQLKRGLGFWDSVAINIGIVIGVGIFRVPSDVAGMLQEPRIILIAWILGGFISLIGVLCYAELSSCYPQSGGTYVYLRESFGKGTAFLFGWMELAVLRAGSFAGVAYVLTTYLKTFFAFDPTTEKFAAIGAILTFTGLNILGLHYGTRVQNVLSTLKVATLLGMAALIFSHDFTPSLPTPPGSPAGNSWWILAPALIPVLWTYGGWNESTFMSGEFKDTRRSLPYSLVASIVIITALYIMMNVAYLKMMSPAEMSESKSIASDIFRKLFGSQGQKIIAVAVIISACGALNSYIMTGARIPFAMAQDTQKISWLGKVHAKYQTPVYSYAFNTVWASLLVLWGSFEDLLFLTGFAKWFFFALAGISVFRLRAKLKQPDAYALAGYPWVPLIFIFVSVVLFATTVLHAPKASLLGGGLLAAGLPFYFLLNKRK